jgi:hypothetical protein
MRPNSFSVAATLVLVSTEFLVTYAVAQPNRVVGGGFAGPQISAPAPHIAVPAPHFAAPHVAAPPPHFVTPVPHFTAPHVAAPIDVASPRGLLPRITSERLAAPGPGAVAGHNLARGLSTVGPGPAAHSHNLAEPSQTLIQGANHREILRNPAFAGLSSRDPVTRTLARSTFQGKFAQSRFAREFDWLRHREHFGIVLGFVGPLFWPYAFDDFIDYTFWPHAYDTFWPYAFDDVYEGIYGPYAPEYYPSWRGPSRTAALTEGAPQVCTGEAAGLTDFPIERIVQQVQPDQDQQRLLDGLKVATGKAIGVLQAACPTELPSTPTGRLAAMRQRVEAMLQAVQLVRPALEKFYEALSDEQKDRLNALDESNRSAGQHSRTSLNCAGNTGRKSAIYRPSRSSGRCA